MSKNILVIAAHPDDEVLGCGGTMAKHIQQGDTVNVVILAEGWTSRDLERSRDNRTSELSELARDARKANDILGIHTLDMESFPDNRMDSLARLDVVKVVEKYIEKYTPSVIYTHHGGDVNVDHRRIHDAVITSCRPIPDSHKVTTLLFFEVASSTEWQPPGSAPPFVPNWFVDITDELDMKISALREYKSEMRPWPHARSLKALDYLAKWRGANIGVEAAEAFVLGRHLPAK